MNVFSIHGRRKIKVGSAEMRGREIVVSFDAMPAELIVIEGVELDGRVYFESKEQGKFVQIGYATGHPPGITKIDLEVFPCSAKVVVR